MPSTNRVQVERVALSAGDRTLAGLRASGDGRGTIIALHGGGYDARYWHASSQLSLLEAGAAAGFTVIAIDRPGYRDSAPGSPSGYSLAQQADILFDMMDDPQIATGAPIFLIGHSLGGILALRMAADRRAGAISAIDVSGVPLRYPAEMEPIIERSLIAALEGTADVRPDKAACRWMFYDDPSTFDEAAADGVDAQNATPAAEMPDAARAPQQLPPLMNDIALPVQWTIAAQERSSVGGQTMLDHIRTLLPNCPRLMTTLQPASGHNISVHHVGRAYHLRALAFFEEDRALRYASSDRTGSSK